MNRLALRNLFQDRVKLAVTLTGIVFAIVLILVQIGLLIGFMVRSSNVIDHSNADLWIAGEGVHYFDLAPALSEHNLYQALATPGIETAEKYIARWSRWKLPDGTEESVQIIGFNLQSRTGGPWNIVSGEIDALKAPDTVIMDESYREKLGVTHLGQRVEINGYRARIVGFTRGIRALTTTPHIFTSFKNALNYTGLREDQTTYILAKAATGVDVNALQQRLSARIRDVEVYSTSEFSRKTRYYWIFSTGGGFALLLAALMGLIVGIVVVSQTIYATTMDHLREFGTLKAMGAANGYLYKVILTQAAIGALIGYLMGIPLGFLIAGLSEKAGASVVLPWELVVGMLAMALLMSTTAAMVSIKKVTTLDPAMVFKA